MDLILSLSERSQLDEVLAMVNQAVDRDETIRLPEFDPLIHGGSETALHLVGIEPNPFGGSIGEFRYQFEGEDDLLHLFVVRIDGQELTAEAGQKIASVVLEGVPPGLIWLKPGKFTQHFYFGGF